MDQYHEGQSGSVFDGDLTPLPELHEAGQLVTTGSGLDDAIALVTAVRDGRAAMFAHEIELMRSGTPRVMSTLVALSRMAAFFLEATAIHSEQDPDRVLQDFALRHQSCNRHPSQGT